MSRMAASLATNLFAQAFTSNILSTNMSTLCTLYQTKT